MLQPDWRELDEVAAQRARAPRTPGRRTLTEALPPASGVGRTPTFATVVQRAARDGNGVAGGADAAVSAAASSSGAALPRSLLRSFQTSLGSDLSGVRVHTGAASARAADALGARAYTLGQDIHFAAGAYDPASQAGRHLLAHEVAHTVQQGRGGAVAQAKLAVSEPGDAAEREADHAADVMLRGEAIAIGAAPTGIQRDKDPHKLGKAEAGPALPDGVNLSVTYPRAVFRVSWLKEQGFDVNAASALLPIAVARAVMTQVRNQHFPYGSDDTVEQLAKAAQLDGGPFTDTPFVGVQINVTWMIESFGLPASVKVAWAIGDQGNAMVAVSSDQFENAHGAQTGNQIEFDDAKLQKQLTDALSKQTGLVIDGAFTLTGKVGARGVVREFTREEFAALVSAEELDRYLADRKVNQERTAGKKGADAGGGGFGGGGKPGTPDAKADDKAGAGQGDGQGDGKDAANAKGDPNGKGDANAKGDPNGKADGKGDASAKGDPNGKADGKGGPSGKQGDLNSDPRNADPTPIGPIYGNNKDADPATAKKSVEDIVKLYEFLFKNFPDHPAFKQGKTLQDFVNWLASQKSQGGKDEDFTYIRPRGQWLAFLDKFEQNATLEKPADDATWPESLVSFKPQGKLVLDPQPTSAGYVAGTWVVATLQWATEGMSAMLAENPSRCEYKWSVAGSQPGDITAHLGQEVWEGDLSKIISMGVTTRGQNTFRFTFPREGKFAFRCVATSEHFERLAPYELTTPELTVGNLKDVDQKQFDDHTTRSIEGPFEYVDGVLRVRPGIPALTVEDQIAALEKLRERVRANKPEHAEDIEAEIDAKIKKLKEVKTGLDGAQPYIISGTMTPDSHGQGGPVAFLMYGTKKVADGKISYDVRLIDQTLGKPEVHNGSGSAADGDGGDLAAEKAAIAAAAAHFTSSNHLPDGQVHVGLQLLSTGVVEQQTWSTKNLLKSVEEQAGNAAAWAGRIALAAAIIGTDGAAGTVIELGAAGLTVVHVGLGARQRYMTGTLGDDKVKEAIDVGQVALALAGPIAKTKLGSVVLPPGFVAIALPTGNHLVMAVEQEQELEKINRETDVKLLDAKSDADKQKINGERQARINALLYRAAQDHMLMGVQEVAGHLHGQGKEGFEDPKASAKDKAGGKPDESGARPEDKAGGKPEDKAGGKPEDKAGGKPEEKAGAKPEDKAGGKPEDKAGGKPGTGGDGPGKAREARRGKGGRDADAEARASGDPREGQGPSRDVAAERVAVDHAIDTLAKSNNAVDHNTAEAIVSGRVKIKTRGELVVTQEAQGVVHTMDPDTGEGGLAWAKGTKAIASRQDRIIYIDPGQQGGDLAADIRHEVNHALHVSDIDSMMRHDSLSRFQDEFRAHWAEGDHDPLSVRTKILANYPDLGAEYANNPAFKARVDAVTKPTGNVINSIRLEPVYTAIDRFELHGEKPGVEQLEKWFGGMDATEKQILADDGRFRRWLHDDLGLSEADHQRLLKQLPADAAKPAPTAPGDEGQVPHARQTDTPPADGDHGKQAKARTSTKGVDGDGKGKAPEGDGKGKAPEGDGKGKAPDGDGKAGGREEPSGGGKHYVSADPAELAKYRANYPDLLPDPNDTPVYRYAADKSIPDDGVTYWQTHAPHPDYVAPQVIESTVGALRAQGEVRIDHLAPEAHGRSVVVLHAEGVTELPGTAKSILGREGAQGTGAPVVEGKLPEGMWRDWEGNVYEGKELVRAARR